MPKKIALLTVTICFLLTGTALAGPPGHDREMGMPLLRWWKMPAMAKQLSITPGESEKLDALYTATKKALIDQKAAIEKKMLSLEMLLSGETFDKKACLNAFEEVQALRTQLATERFQFVLNSREILGNDRFQQLMKIHDKKQGHYCPRDRGAGHKADGPPRTGPYGNKRGCPVTSPNAE